MTFSRDAGPDTIGGNLDDRLLITSQMSGDNIGGTGTVAASATDATPAGVTFDTFALRPSTPECTATSFVTSQFKVETGADLVPEPGSFSLLAMGGLMALRRRRRWS